MRHFSLTKVAISDTATYYLVEASTNGMPSGSLGIGLFQEDSSIIARAEEFVQLLNEAQALAASDMQAVRPHNQGDHRG